MTSMGLLAPKSQTSFPVVKSISSLSLNAQPGDIHAKEYFRGIYISLAKNMSHFDRQPLLDMVPFQAFGRFFNLSSIRQKLLLSGV